MKSEIEELMVHPYTIPIPRTHSFKIFLLTRHLLCPFFKTLIQI